MSERIVPVAWAVVKRGSAYVISAHVTEQDAVNAVPSVDYPSTDYEVVTLYGAAPASADAALAEKKEKWCSYCRADSHTDSECSSTRPVTEKKE